MNGFLNRLERKLGKYAIRNLSLVLVGCFAAGYVIQLIKPEFLNLMALDPMYILKGQIWRLFTWIVVPPSSLGIFTLVMLFFYFSIGTTLERTWGTFRYNVYIFGGMLIMVIAAFICYAVLYAVYGQPVSIGGAFSTSYICMSLFLAYALTYPDMQVLLMFVIPIRVKWLGIIYGIYIAYDVLTYVRSFAATGNPGYLVMIVSIVASVANFLIFFLTTRNYRKYDPREMKRKRDFQRSMEEGRRANAARTAGSTYGARRTQGPVQDVYSAGRRADGTQVFTAQPTRHRCCICGRTEISNPELTFRFCSKCAGSREYCSDHLFTHEHVKE